VEASVSSERMLAALENGMALYGDGCGRCFESRRSDRAGEFVETIIWMC